VADTDILSFEFYNDNKCALVQVPMSDYYEGFRRAEKSTKWVDQILAAVGSEDLKISAEWLLQNLAERHNDSFVNAACSTGELLHSKKRMLKVHVLCGKRQMLDFGHSASFCVILPIFWPKAHCTRKSCL
jgi:hypothetical protein